MALTQVSTGGIKDGQVHTADLADAQITAGKLHADALDHTYTLGASGTDHYTFTGEGLTGAVNDPTLYLTRGKTYRFVNGNSSGAHPFRIQSVAGAGGTEYNTGVTNNAGAGGSTIIFEVPHDAPDVLYYICTSHASMNGIFYVTGALADGTVTTAKLADDAVTDAKIANSINTAIAANTAKTTNATHTGEVTGSTALTIADDVVDEANLKVSNSPTNGYLLSAQSGNTGGLTWVASPASDVVDDTTPQLGGDLQSNGNDIDVADNDKAVFGTGGDLEIFHDGSNSKFVNTTGHVIFNTNSLDINNAADNETLAKFDHDGAVELYYDNSKKIETTANGATVTGTVAQTVLPSWSLRPNTASTVAGFPHSSMGHTIGWSANTTGSSAKACHLSGGCTIAGMTGSPVGNGFQLAGGSTSGKVIVPLAGKYMVWTSVRFEVAVNVDNLRMFVNGTEVAREYTVTYGTAYSPHKIGPLVLDLAANDYIEIVVEANIPSGGFSGYNDRVNWFCGHYIG